MELKKVIRLLAAKQPIAMADLELDKTSQPPVQTPELVGRRILREQ